MRNAGAFFADIGRTIPSRAPRRQGRRSRTGRGAATGLSGDVSRPVSWPGLLLAALLGTVALQDPWLGYGVNWAQRGTLPAISGAAAVLAAPALRHRQ